MKPIDTTSFNLLIKEIRSKKITANEAAQILIKVYRLIVKCLTPGQYQRLLKLL